MLLATEQLVFCSDCSVQRKFVVHVLYLVISFVLVQVERRVVSQLALAHERLLINKGCGIKLTVANAKDETELTKSNTKGNTEHSGKVPVIKLQRVKKGVLKNEYVDINLDNSSNSFTS